MGELFIGTSGYSYDDWVGPFYPPSLSQDEFLPYYAKQFSMTELNFSYYRQPSQKTIEGMVKRTPDTFRFSIKAHRSITHDVAGGWREEVERFVGGIAALTENDRLLGVLLQFPYRFHYTVGNRRYLANLCRAMEGLPLYLEFRHKEWQRQSVYEQMGEMGLGLVYIDMPALLGLPTSPVADGGDSASVTIVPADRAYIRFHGRNEQNWWEGDNTTRYDYRYSEEELESWLPIISALRDRTSVLVVAFNNHANGNAVANARQLIRMVAG